jgi:hypothetical protein
MEFISYLLYFWGNWSHISTFLLPTTSLHCVIHLFTVKRLSRPMQQKSNLGEPLIGPNDIELDEIQHKKVL